MMPFARILLFSVSLIWLPGQGAAQLAPGDVLAAFHEALSSGDSLGALALLADEAVILESGGTEDKGHYRSGHLSADIRFAQATTREATVISAGESGDVAWILSETHTVGTVGEREIDSRGVETAMLRRTPEGWRIVHLHWSARRR